MSKFVLDMPVMEKAIERLNIYKEQLDRIGERISARFVALTDIRVWSGAGKNAYVQSISNWENDFNVHYGDIEKMLQTLETIYPAAEELNKQALAFASIVGGGWASVGNINRLTLAWDSSANMKACCKNVYDLYEMHKTELGKARTNLSNVSSFGFDMSLMNTLATAINNRMQHINDFRTAIIKYEGAVDDLEGDAAVRLEGHTYPPGWDSERVSRTISNGGALSFEDIENMPPDVMHSMMGGLLRFFSQLPALELEADIEIMRIPLGPNLSFYVDLKDKTNLNYFGDTQGAALKFVTNEAGAELSTLSSGFGSGNMSGAFKAKFGEETFFYEASAKTGERLITGISGQFVLSPESHSVSYEMRTTWSVADSNRSFTLVNGLTLHLGNTIPGRGLVPANIPSEGRATNPSYSVNLSPTAAIIILIGVAIFCPPAAKPAGALLILTQIPNIDDTPPDSAI